MDAAADFEKEDWLTRLVQAGFDPGKPALFLLEGVILYLDREAVESTLRKIASTAQSASCGSMAHSVGSPSRGKTATSYPFMHQ